jgi:hypothetical protein
MSSHIKSQLKSANVIIRDYVRKVEAENEKHQRIIAKLECMDMSQKHEISALKKKLNAYLKKVTSRCILIGMLGIKPNLRSNYVIN